MGGLPPLIQRKNSGSRMKLQYEDGKAQAEADLKAINDKIQKQKNLQLARHMNMS